MIESLSKSYWLPGTRQFDVSAWITADEAVRLDLERSPPRMVFENPSQAAVDGTGVSTRPATQSELDAILAGLQSTPLLRPLMKRLEVMGLFTEQEKSAIRTSAPGLIELLLAAEEPISSEVLIPYFTQLQAGGILTAERFTEITGRAV